MHKVVLERILRSAQTSEEWSWLPIW